MLCIIQVMVTETKKTESDKEPAYLNLVMSPKALVVKSNKLVEARQRLTIQEQRIILLLISKIRPEDVDFLWYKFQILDLAKFLGLESSKRIYIDVRKAIRKLMKRVITIDREARDIDLHWVEAAEYGDKGYVKICINQVLKPYLLNLKAH
ncbi:MAG: replication initiation protein, partial [Candidatus Riflebacteria bacterium]|nr:replication initiation protein [Candidatus Riflebacteria bacterium]